MRLLALLPITALLASAQTYTITTIAGGPQTVERPGTAVALADRVSAITADRQGNVFFASDNSVFRWDAATGRVRAIAGNGTSGLSGDNGPALEGQLSNPWGLAVDAAGAVYVADCGNRRVRKIAGGRLTTVAIGAELGCPTGVAVDSAGNLYIADSVEHRIHKVTKGVITTIAGTGRAGFGGDGGPSAAAQLNSPNSVAVDAAGNLYVSDAQNERIRKIAGGVITTIAGGGRAWAEDGPATNAGLNQPRGLAVDAAGNLCFGSGAGSYIYRVSGGNITIIAGKGYENGDNIPAIQSHLADPACAVDAAGNVFVSDLRRIRKIARGVISTIVGGDAYRTSVPAKQVTLHARALAVDSAGAVYFIDEELTSVLKVASGVITRVAGNGKPVPLAELQAQSRGIIGGVEAPLPPPPPSLRDGGPATAATLDQARSLAIDAKGALYIATRDRVRKVVGGVITTVAGGGDSSSDGVAATQARLDPLSIAVDAAGSLYISEKSRLRKVTAGVVTTIAGPGDSPLDNIRAANARIGATNIAVDAEGAVYFSEFFTHRVRKVQRGVITTVAGNGTPGYSGDGGLATAAQLGFPGSVAVDAAGDLYLTDSQNTRIRKVSNGVITTIAGTGKTAFSGENGPALQATLGFVGALAVDSKGSVYLADTSNKRIRQLTPPAGFVPRRSPAAVSNAPLPVSPLADLSGRVLNEDRQPMGKLPIHLMPIPEHNPALSAFVAPGNPKAITNERGEFRIEALKPGRYYVHVIPSYELNQSKQEAYVATYFPAATSLADATVVMLAAGDDRQGIEIQMQKTRLYTVSGRVTFPPEGTPHNFRNSPDPNPVVGSVVLMTRYGAGDVRRDGSFQIAGVPPGEHEAQAGLSLELAGKLVPFQGLSRFTVSGDVNNLTIPLAPPSTLSGKVIIRDSSVQAERLRIILWERGRSSSDKSVPFDPKTGEFRFADLPAGYYNVSVIDVSRELYAEVRAEGGELDPEGWVRMAGGSPVALELTYSPGSVVRGAVSDGKGGEAVAGPVYLIPANGPLTAQSVFVTYAREGGRYEMRGVRPGSYRLVALPRSAPSVPFGSPQSAAFLDVVRSMGVAFQVGPGGVTFQAPPLVVPVEPR